MASLRSLRLRDFPDGRLRTIAVPVSRLALAHHVPAKLVREDPSNKAFPFPSMLASFPASMLNQSRPDLEIPHRIKLTSSRSRPSSPRGQSSFHSRRAFTTRVGIGIDDSRISTLAGRFCGRRPLADL